VRRAFTGLGVREIVATTMTVNTRSRAVLERAGLRYARTVHLTWDEPLIGNEHGDVEYRLSREDWIGKAP
jgi:RimJ/RimL family protein N-acetyltransferase